jgi:dATP/dGTP diphosphohydrolase, N-terminal
MDIKEVNPKDLIGSGKLPIGLFPQSAIVHGTLAMLEGALKYGRYNFRVAPVRASIYFDAQQRHMFKYWNGEFADPTTQVLHLGSAIACIAIILDAHLKQALIDDRPPVNFNLVREIDMVAGVVKHLQEIFKDHNPQQYTILNTQGEPFDSNRT